jgi:type I restriction-modification system DNA methylase subunit/restriction endonuclease S subunit
MEQQPSSIITGSIQELSSLFKTCLDILRNDAEHLIGDEALNELSYFLILKQSEKHIVSGAIDILNLDLYKDGINFKRYGKEKFQKGLECVKFTKLVEYVKDPDNEGTIKKIFDDFIWKEVLSKHPKFKDIFEDGKKSFIKESTTIKKIVLALSSIDFNNYEYDILGEAYEKIFVDAIFGAGGNKKSELGQFFTPPKVKKLLIKLVNPKLKDNGEIESVLDPASGTGGILNTTIKHFKQFVKSKKITDKELRKQLIKNIYGIEIKGKIFNLCLSNMLINTGEILPNVICADSIRKFHNIKVDNIVANPPFSVTITYDELLKSLGSEEILDNYIPIKTGGKNSEILFLQMMIYCLNINGRCASVMLDGQKMYGSSSGYDTVREYLMRCCDLHEVILCPPGTFTSTASKTCILFFTKKKERKDVLEIKGTKRILKFCDYHSTTKVKFYDFNPDTEEKNFIKEVGIDEIASKKYSLNYTEYGIEEKETKDVEGIEWKELGEVCDFQNGSQLDKKDIIEGDVPVFGGGFKNVGFHNSNNRNGNETIVCGTGAYSGYVNYNNGNPFWASQCFTMKSKNINKMNDKYLYYYSKIILEYKFMSKQKGAGIPFIRYTQIINVKIPIPSLEKQNKIVEFLDNLFTDKYNLQSVAKYYENYDLFELLLDDKYDIFEKLVEWQDQSRELTKQIEFFKNRQNNYLFLVGKSENTIKTLGEVCSINIGGTPKRDTSEYYKDGNNIWVSIRELNDNIITTSTEKITDLGVKESNVKLIPKDTILFSFKLSIGKIAISGCDLYTNEAIAGLIIKDNQVIMKYLYYILKEINTFSSKGCIGGGSLNKKSLGELKIPIPSLEKQKEIIVYCDYNNNLIKQLENEIENNKELAQQFIKGIIKTVTKNELETNDETDDEENDDEENDKTDDETNN